MILTPIMSWRTWERPSTTSVASRILRHVRYLLNVLRRCVSEMLTLFYALLLHRSYLTSSSDTFRLSSDILRPSSTILSFFLYHSFVYLSFFSILSQYTPQILTICAFCSQLTSLLLHSLGGLWSHLRWSILGPMDGNDPSSQGDGISHLGIAVLRGQFCFWKLHYLTTLSVL